MIDTGKKLEDFLATIRAAPWVAVDTEADSLHAYPEKICLIQVSTTAGDALVDPLAGLNLHPFLDALNSHTLIVHGADYDLRLLRKHHDFVPRAIFDTMLAARLLGEKQFGLGALVERFLGVTLEKGSQKANWARRPLTEKMIAYARNDTRHLKPLADKLRAELAARQRLGWHEESCARLIDECARPEPVDHEFVWRVKGSHLLDRAALAVLRELWHWREREAIAANKPPFFILRHEDLVTIAEAAAARMATEPLVPRHLSDRRRAGLAEAVKAGLGLPPDQHPEIPRHRGRRASEAERRRFADITRRRDRQAEKLGLDPTLIASRAMILDLAQNWDTHAPRLMSWQRELLA